MSLLFSQDPITSIRRLWHQDGSGRVVFETQHNVEDIVDDAKARYNTFDERAPWKGDLHHVARIPMPIYMQLWDKGIAQDPDALKAWINDPDNRAFKTRPGKV